MQHCIEGGGDQGADTKFMTNAMILTYCSNPTGQGSAEAAGSATTSDSTASSTPTSPPPDPPPLEDATNWTLT